MKDNIIFTKSWAVWPGEGEAEVRLAGGQKPAAPLS